MRNEQGLSSVETVLIVLIAVALFVGGLAFGGAFEDDDDNPAATPAGQTTVPPPPPPVAGTETQPGLGEPGPASLAAIGLNTSAAERSAAAERAEAAGADAAATLLSESAKVREQAAEGAAYWAAVGDAISSVEAFAVGAEQLRTAQQVRHRKTVIQALQVRALIALARLRQMRATAQRRRVAIHLLAGAGQAINRSIVQTETAVGNAANRASNQAARQLSRAGAGLHRTLARMSNLYEKAVAAAANGEEQKAEALLDRLETVAGRLR